MKAKLKKYQAGGAKKATKAIMTAGEKAAKEYLGAGSAGIKAGMKKGMAEGMKKGYRRGVAAGAAGTALTGVGIYGAMTKSSATPSKSTTPSKPSTPVKKVTPKPAVKSAPKPAAKARVYMKMGGMMKSKKK